MRPFDKRRLAFDTSTGGATTRFCVNTAAADAGTSLVNIARSSAPVFFRPHAVAANRNPLGSAASDRACFMSAAFCSLFFLEGLRSFFEAMILRIPETVSMLPGPDAASIFLAIEPLLLLPFFEVLASDCRK